jgi:phenylacetate-CoA ligase
MGKFDIEQYQIIQDDSSSITCNIVKGKTYKEEDEQIIRNSFYSHVGKIIIKFNYVESIPTAHGDKHKFIINDFGPL